MLPWDTAFLAQAATTLGLRREGKWGQPPAPDRASPASPPQTVKGMRQRRQPCPTPPPKPPRTLSAPEVAPRGLGAQVPKPILFLNRNTCCRPTLLPLPLPPTHNTDNGLGGMETTLEG